MSIEDEIKKAGEAALEDRVTGAIARHLVEELLAGNLNRLLFHDHVDAGEIELDGIIYLKQIAKIVIKELKGNNP